MNKKCISLVILICASLVLIVNCGKETPSGLTEGLNFYRQNQLEEASSAFERAIKEDKTNADAYAWLGETYRRLNLKEKALIMAGKALELDSCHSFAHTIIGTAYNPMYGEWKNADSDSAWYYLLKAVECDSTDGNAWIGVWPEAIRRGNRVKEKKALRSLIESGFLTPAILAYNRWMLRYLPENSILLTNGDMDTYPAVALQEVENYCPDVVVVNYSLLNTAWYARFLRDQYGVKLPFTDTELENLRPYKNDNGRLITSAQQIMKEWTKMHKSGSFRHPIAISVTVEDLSFADDSQDHLRMEGAFSLWLPNPAESPQDTSMMRISLEGVNPEDFTGSFVSSQDRSSVRIVASNRIVTNITALALRYCKTLLESKRISEANNILLWAEQFENNTKVGPVFSQEIQKLKEEIYQDNK